MATSVSRSAAYPVSEISGVWSDMWFLPVLTVLALLRYTLGGMCDGCKTPQGVSPRPHVGAAMNTVDVVAENHEAADERADDPHPDIALGKIDTESEIALSADA